MKNTTIALIKYFTGQKPSISTFIDEETITMGYGNLNSMGWFEYPLPDFIVRCENKGALTWEEFKETDIWKTKMEK